MSVLLVLSEREALALQREHDLMRLVFERLEVTSLVAEEQNMLASAHRKLNLALEREAGKSGSLAQRVEQRPFLSRRAPVRTWEGPWGVV